MGLSSREIANRIERIRNVYREYLVKLFPLRKEREELVSSYIKSLEAKKLERLNQDLKSHE